MYKIFTIIIVLFTIQACTYQESKPKLFAKEVLHLDYGVNSNFGFSKDTIIIYSYAGKTDKQNSTYSYFSTGLYKPYSDSIIKDEKFSNVHLSEDAFTKIIKKDGIYIHDIYSTRFRYDVIEDSFNIYPSGGAMADIVLNKPGTLNDTTSAIYQFSKKNNVQALKTYKNYWVYLTYDTGISCKTFINILNTETKEKYKIATIFCPGQVNFLLYDIMNEEKPEIIFFHTPVFIFRDVGTLKIFKIIE